MTARQGDVPVAYRCPVTPRDLSRLTSGRAHVHVTVRRRPPHLVFVLVPRGRRAFPTSWSSTTARVYFEPSALEARASDAPPPEPPPLSRRTGRPRPPAR